jgi:hypothetical protein
MTRPDIRRSVGLRAALVLLLAFVLAGCGRTPTEATWRNVTIDLPDGWVVVDQADDHLSLANRSPDDDELQGSEGTVVVLGLTYVPGVVPDDWRRLIVDLGGTLESDDAILVGGDVPATRFVWSATVDGVRSRTMVVVIPSRWIVALAEPVASGDAEDPADALLGELDAVLGMLVGATFGPPDLS